MANMKFFNVLDVPVEGAVDGTYYVKSGDYIDTYLVSSGKVEKLSAQDDLALKADHGYDSSPKTLKEVDDEKADHGYASIEVAKTLKQVEDDTSVKMTNLLQNSSFENGVVAPVVKVDSGGGASTLSINTINPISGNYDARLEVTTPSTIIGRPTLRLNGNQGGWVLDHVFYFGMSVKVNSGTPEIHAVYNGAGNSRIDLTLKDGFNSWTVECLGNDNFALIYLNGTTLWDFNFDNLIAYDLTAIFGERNEPTKEEMDLLISTLGIDYFEGEITIPAQKVMQWRLEMIRQKAAILAIHDDLADISEQMESYGTVFNIFQPESANLLNPNTVTPNVVLVAKGGTTGNGVGPDYDTSDFIAVFPSTVYKGLTDTNAALSFRFISFYTNTKSHISVLESSSSFTTPEDCAYIRVSWSNGSNTVNPINRGVFLSTVATFSVFEFPYIELSNTKNTEDKSINELATKGDIANLISSEIFPQYGSLSMQVSDAEQKDVVITSGGVSATMAVRKSENANKLIRFTNVNLFGLSYGNTDDIAPVHIQNSTVGANHGWRGDVLTCVAHGLTESNVGDELTANDGVKFTVMRIDSVDTFTVLRENEGSSIYFHSNTGWNGQTSLTDGVATYIITDSAQIQYYPSVNKKYVKIFKDRKEVVANSSFYADIAELVEEYDILNKESLRLNAVAPESALSSINVKNTYQFRKGGISYVFCRYKIGHELVFSNIMAAQAVMLSTTGYFYAPKILPFPDSVDLRRLTLFSALGGVSRTFNDTLWESGKIPNRVTNYTADKSKALMLGILTDRGVGKDLGSFTKDTFEIRGNSGKTYPHPVSSTSVGATLSGGEVYDIAMFRAYFEPIGNVDKVELPLESKTIVIVDIHEVGTFTVKLSDNLNGGLINVTDSQNAIMHGDIVVNSEIEITTSSDYSYIEFEVS